jgi:hypothetical protein
MARQYCSARGRRRGPAFTSVAGKAIRCHSELHCELFIVALCRVPRAPQSAGDPLTRSRRSGRLVCRGIGRLLSRHRQRRAIYDAAFALLPGQCGFTRSNDGGGGEINGSSSGVRDTSACESGAVHPAKLATTTTPTQII